ncbi:MAG: erythromycin biosynthesis sensory transduction protein eryC1, partial [Candidatus Heimdallarchaeota archaeon]|nr:erythromycin biosynthesis sensory transduction protein eryC1 [Candidatus Heimdallarchaeota archaeon]
EDVISKRTKAIIPVHLYGLMSDMNPIKDIAEDNNLSILEDACQAHGAEYFSKRAGSIGDLTAFSFFPTKNVTVAGDGGIVLSNNEKLIDKIKALRDHGRRNGKHVMIGLNNRLSEILAAIGRAHLKKLDKYNDNRRKIADTYNQHLKDISEIVTPIEPEGYKHVYHLFTIKTKKRDELKKYLKENDIGTKIMYEERLNELDYVKQTAGNQPMPINDEVNQEILSLPISGTLDLEKINCVCDKIREFYN